MKIEDYLSTLDTNRFGFNIAKVNNFDLSPEKIVGFLKEKNIKLILSKIPTEEFRLINNLEKLNFQIKDIQATYKFDISNIKGRSFQNNKNKLLIRDYCPQDIPALEDIASIAFKNYGHYFRDENLDKKKCIEIYVDWIKRSCENLNVADKVMVAEHRGTVAGFLTFKLFESNSNKYAAGGIGAVSSELRNLGIFRELIMEGLNWGKEIGLSWEEHNVLIDNYPVNQSFANAGFRIYKSFVSMHCWIK